MLNISSTSNPVEETAPEVEIQLMFGSLLIPMVLLILHVSNMLPMTGMLHQLTCKSAKTAHGLHVQLMKLGTQQFAKIHAGPLPQTECITPLITILLLAKIKCKESSLKMDQWNAQFKPLMNSKIIQVVFILRFYRVQFNLTIQSLY